MYSKKVFLWAKAGHLETMLWKLHAPVDQEEGQYWITVFFFCVIVERDDAEVNNTHKDDIY